MKRLLLSLAITLGAFFPSSQAAVFTVENLTIEPGQTGQLVVGVNNTETNLSGFQFKLSLPEGMLLTKNQKGKFIFTLSERIEYHTLSITELADGGYQFICYSMDADLITGNSGELLSISVTADDTFSGYGEGALSNSVVTDVDTHTSNCNNVSFTVGQPMVYATGISLNSTTLTLTSSCQTATLTATVTPSNATNKSVTWTSSNTAIATVSNTGVVTAKSNGTATITAKTADGTNLKATCAVTVAIPVLATGISLNSATLTLTSAGQTATLTATVTPSNATNKNVTWTSSNTAVATVSSTGIVTAKANGTAVITATTVDGTNLSAQCTINVSITPPSPDITFADDAVKALCVANWDTNHDGELSEAEAATVTTLGEVFKENTEITSFDELAYFTGLTSIGNDAFRKCSGLTSLTIPEGVTSIGNYAFYFCSGLTSLTIPESVTSISDYTFYGCSGLTSLTIPEGVTSIRDYAFSYCSGLTSLTIPEGVTSIGGFAFCDCSGLTSLTIPEGVTSIGNYAFWGCSGLTSLTIPEGVTSIGGSAFKNCSGLTSLTIPEGVNSIGGEAFFGCSGLTSINVATSNTVYDSRGNCNAIIEKASNTLIAGCKNTVIPEGVTSIGNDAFSGCSGLTSLTIPEGVNSIGVEAFYGCSGLTSLTIPEGVTSIGNYAFYFCSGLTSLTLPEGVTSIGNYTFYYCSGLTSLTIPEGVTSIGNFAFSGCSGLTSINVATSNTVYDSRGNCNAIIEKASNTLIAGCKNTVIPEGVTSIGNKAFYCCSGLTSLTIPEGVTSIGYDAFYGCSGLTSLTIPEGVTSIGNGAFLGCSGLTSLTIPDGVTSIGDYAFRDCSSLTSVYVKMETPPAITANVFSNRANATLYVPYGCSGVYEGAAYWQEFMEIVEMPAPWADIEEDIYFLKNVETGKYLNAGNAWGTHAVLADEPLPARISKQPDGCYTIFFPVGSYHQQLLFRDSMEDVYVDYNGQESGCPYWTITDIGNGNYHIQSLTTHETYGQEAMPGTYLGNDPDKEATDGNGYALGVYNDVDGNVTEGKNITWTLEPLPPRTEAQVSQLQELVTTAQELGLDTSEAEAALNNDGSLYLAIFVLQRRIIAENNRISLKLQDLTMLIACANAVGVNTDEAQAVADSPSSMDAVTNAIITLREAYIAKLGEGVSSSLLPLNVTGVILNPSFVIDNADGWSCDDETPNFQSYNNAEYYQKTFDIHQTISGLPNGNYVLKVKGYHRPGGNQDVYSDYQQGINNASAELYANGEAVILNNQASGAQDTQLISNDNDWSIVSYNDVTKYVPNSMHGARSAFNAGLYENELPFTVTDGTLTFGIRLEESVDEDWLIFDDFRLEYLGEEENNEMHLYAEETSVRCGSQAVIPVLFENEKEYGGLQFEVTLPAGITLNKLTKTERLSDDFMLQKNQTGDNTWLILLFNSNRLSFTGNDGALFTMTVDVADEMMVGDYTMTFSDIVATDVDENQEDLANFSVPLHVEKYLIGDANRDNRVNVTDIMAVANYILKQPGSNFNIKAADVNNDNRVNVTDIMGIANIILKVTPAQSAPARIQTLDPQ